MIQPGNVDLTKRPMVHHPDNSISTLYSGSFQTDAGSVLVPFVSPTGKMLNEAEALAEYKRTGKMLGIFKTDEQADAYSEMLHQKQVAYQLWKNGGKWNGPEVHDDWKEPQ